MNKSFYMYLLIFSFMIVIAESLFNDQNIFGTIQEPDLLTTLNGTSPSLSDPSLKIEIFASGLELPTNMVFLDSGDALVLEKNNGTIKRIVNGKIMTEPLLDVNVATYDTRGMLGIATAKNDTAKKQYVFVYYTEAKDGQGDGGDKCIGPSKCQEGRPNENRLYRYELSEAGSKLTNQKLIFALPPFIRADHNGGELIVGPDNNLYLTVGDGTNSSEVRNKKDKVSKIDGSAGILSFNHNGGPIFSEGLLGNEDPLNRYYAYGIRNSFGIDFDPITGILWDTENGPVQGDEINLVKPGFNSGWTRIQGIWEPAYSNKTERGFTIGKIDLMPKDLVDFNGKGNYSSPELTWNISNSAIAPTAIKFLNSQKYGDKYKNDIFVGTVEPDGDLYHFELNSNRTALDLEGPLIDRIADNYEELASVVFGKNFGIISDLEVGPDGYLYIVSHTRGEIYRIIPETNL